MKAVVFHGIGDIRLDDMPEPKIQESSDAIVRITASAICGTDLHMIRGTFPGMKPGTILGHEGVGVVEEIGSNVRNLKVGDAPRGASLRCSSASRDPSRGLPVRDRVVIPSTIGCGYCSYHSTARRLPL